jgi:hypothetical protein
VSRVSDEPVYLVSDEQLHLLRHKKLPFELIAPPNGRATRRAHG